MIHVNIFHFSSLPQWALPHSPNHRMKRRSLCLLWEPKLLCAIWMFAYSSTGIFGMARTPDSKVPEPATVERPVPFRQIGKIVPRSSKEIASSGWSMGCETLDRDMASYSDYKGYLGTLGVKGARLQAGWAKTEKRSGVYDWKWLDEIIDDALSQGVQPWVSISYGNPIYEGGGGISLGGGLPKSETALKAWDAWAKALVQRYKNRVTAWEIWNEPEWREKASTSTHVTPEEYVALYIRTAEMIRAEAPDAKIYALGIGGKLEFADTFLASLAAQGKLGLVDAITFHGYPSNPDNLSLYTGLKEIVDKYHAGIALRQGETGAPSGKTIGALSSRVWTELSQAKWDLRRLLVHYHLGIPINLFTLFDIIYSAKHDPKRFGKGSFGLLDTRDDHSIDHPKAAYFAAQNVFSLFDDSVVLEERFTFTPNTAEALAVHGYRKKPSGASLVAIWFNGAPPSETNDLTPVDFTFRGVHFEHPVYVDLRTGGVFEIPSNAWSREGGEVKFRAVPIYDSPILIADQSAFLFALGADAPQSAGETNPFLARLKPLGRILDLSDQNYAVWDCSPIRDDAGKVHVFFTRVPYDNIKEWFKNFRTQRHIVHAVADKPEGPYTVQEVVIKGSGQGNWDRFGIVNPRVYRVEGGYALFFTSYEAPWPKTQVREHIGVLLSTDLKTWRRGNGGKPILSPSPDPAAWDHQVINNASLVRDPASGQYRLYYRGVRGRVKGAVPYRIGFAIADSIEGPWRPFEKNPVIDPDNLPAPHGKFYDGYEDPCVWIENGKYYMLTKDKGYFLPRGGALFESADGTHWGKPIRGYLSPDDTPQMLFDVRGKPEYLFVNRYKPEPLTGFVYKMQ